MLSHRRKAKGFTLIEVMIVVAIVGILAAIAYPSYQESVRKTRVGQGKEGAMQIATVLERRAASENKYPTDLTDTSISKPYSDLFTYDLTGDSDASGYVLRAKDKVFDIQVWVNSRGTRCFCDRSCTGGITKKDETTCSSGSTSF